ncbi:hypothetical protein L484_023485 [Morus notabilis]|uniref:Uncharacterized protein n=1 Tax=Morus notabilis TaxID=981085 RepID=W9RNZ6_9ROSA|nr:hypothetical protein L484_023485 [Morus notabilis]
MCSSPLLAVRSKVPRLRSPASLSVRRLISPFAVRSSFGFSSAGLISPLPVSLLLLRLPVSRHQIKRFLIFAEKRLSIVEGSAPRAIRQNLQHGSLMETDLDLRIAVHYGIPSTSSILAFDPIQRLLAIGTLDGRIKVIGGDGIGLLISPKQLPFKYIEIYLSARSNRLEKMNEEKIYGLEVQKVYLTEP